jgi:hypothetical protein
LAFLQITFPLMISNTHSESILPVKVCLCSPPSFIPSPPSLVPFHRLVYPRLVARSRPSLPTEPAIDLFLEMDAGNGSNKMWSFPLESVTSQLLANRLTVVRRTSEDGGGQLETIFSPSASTTPFDDCHFHHNSPHAQLAISNCEDGELVGLPFTYYSVKHSWTSRHSSLLFVIAAGQHHSEWDSVGAPSNSPKACWHSGAPLSGGPSAACSLQKGIIGGGWRSWRC